MAEAGELAVEREQRATTALAAQVEQHGITQHTPQHRESVGVSVTPKRTPKKVKPPSPVRTDADGNTWTWEDDNSEEEQEGGARNEGLLAGAARLPPQGVYPERRERRVRNP